MKLSLGLLAVVVVAAAACDGASSDDVGDGGPSGESPGGGGPGGSNGGGGDAGAADGSHADAGPKAPRSTAPTPLPVPDGFYPRAIQRADGTIVASVVRFLPSQRMGAAIFESKDDGLSFTEIGHVDDPRTQSGLCCGTLFELPRAIGGLAAGTLLWSASAGGDAPDAPMSIPVWKSADGGRTWSFVSNVVVASVPRKSGGLWEPELAMLDDGTLVCHYSDETDPAHSQKLVETKSSDGVTWGNKTSTVALGARGDRPGMANVRRAPGGVWHMTYEICALPNDSCTAFFRTSTDGWNWGDPANAGVRIATVDGRAFRHAPTLAWTAAPGHGRFFVVGQLVFGANGAQGPGSGTVLFANTEDGFRPWYEIAAPVPVPDAYDNFCPNYSSTLLPLDGGDVVLEIASRWDGKACRSYFARGPLVDTSDASEVKDGDAHHLVSVMSGLCLDVAGGSSAAGANVQQYGCNGGPAQRWSVQRAATGAVSLKSDVSGMCLTVRGNGAAPGTNVEQQPCDGGPAQAWKLRAMGVGTYELTRAGGTCLDVAGGSIEQGGNVATWTCNDLSPQLWHFE